MNTCLNSLKSGFNPRVCLLLLAAAIMAVAAPRAQAQNYTNILTGNWSVAGSWSASPGAPAAGGGVGDAIIFNPSAADTSTNDLAGAFLLNQLMVAPNQTVTINSNATSFLVFTNNGATMPVLTNAGTSTLTINSAITVATNLTVGAVGPITLNAGLTGSNTLSLTKAGAGTVTLAGGLANTFSGPINVNAGLLQTTTGTSVKNLTNTLTVASGASFDLDGNYDGTVCSSPMVLSGTGAGLNNWGALNVAQNGTVSGPITLQSNVKITHDYNNGQFNSTITGVNVNLELDNFIAGQPGAIMAGAINLGTGVLTVNSAVGAPPVYLNVANSYSGGTVINNGGVQLGNASALGTGGLTLNGGTVNLNGYALGLPSLSGLGGFITDNASGAGPTALTVTQTVATTFSGSINNGTTRVLNLTLGGTGALALLGANTYSGATAVNTGELIGGTGGSAAYSSVNVAAGATNGIQAVAYGAQWSCASLTYAGNATLDLNLTTLPVSTTVAPLLVNGNLTASGTVNIIVRNGYWPAAGTYPLVSYTGGLTGGANFTLLSLPSGVSATLVNNTAANRLDLSVTAVPTVSQPTSVWTNLVAGNAGGIWGTNLNWSPNTAPNAVDAVANFSTVAITANSFITNDTHHTVGALVFANGSGHTWTVDGTNAQLTLTTSLGLPTINVTNTQVFLGGFNGSGGLIKNGPGAVAIYGQNYSNSLSGPIVINGGLLGTVGSTAFAHITSPITVASGASFEANADYQATAFANTIYLSGAGCGNPSGYDANTQTPDGTYNGEGNFGALDLHGNVTYSGTINLNADSVISHGYNVATITGPIVASGTGHNLQLAITVGGQYPTTVSSGMNLGNGALTVNSVAGGGSSGGAAVVLNAANTYSGGTILTNYAILQLGNAGALGSGGLTLYPNSILNLNTYNISLPSLIGAAGSAITDRGAAGTTTLTVNQSTATTYAGIITNGATRTVALTKLGTGTLTLSGVNTYSGLTTVSNGTLIGVTGGSCANSLVNLANATNGIQVVTAGGQWACAGLTNNTGNNSTLNFDFTTNTPSTSTAPLQVNGNVTFNGTVTINLLNANNFQAGNSYPLIAYTGSFVGTVPNTPVLPPRMAASLQTISGSPNTLSLVVSATGAEPLAWNATGSTAIWDANDGGNADWLDANSNPTYYQQTTIGDSVVFNDNDTAPGSSTLTVVLDQTVIPASVQVNNSAITSYTIEPVSGGQIAGTGSLTKSGTGSLTLSTSNSYTGGTVVSQGLLSIGSGGTLGAATGSLTVQGTAATGVNGAVLNLGGSSQIVGKATLGGTVSNGTLTASAFIVQSPSVNGNLAVSANLAGVGASLTMATNPAGNMQQILVLSGTNTYTGGTLDNAGTLRLGSGYAVGTGPLTIQSGTGNPTVWLDLDGQTLTNAIANTGGDCYVRNTSANPANLSGPVTLGSYTRLGYYGTTVYGSVGSMTISGTLGGTWSEKQGASLLVLTGTNTYTSPTYISGGVVRAADGVGINTNSNLRLADGYGVGAVFESTGGNIVRALGAGANQVQLTTALSSESCGFSAYGAPVTVALGGVSTPATLQWGALGTTTFSPGALVLNYYSANTNLTLLNPIDLNGNASAKIAVYTNLASINAAIIDSTSTGVGLTKNGGGTLNLNGVNTYTGLTEATAGTLGGTGSLAGSLLIDAAATLAPGANAPSTGIFTVSGTVNLNGAAVFGINRANVPNADQLAASSTVSVSGPLTVNNLGANLQANDSFQIINGTISGTFTATNLPALTGSLTWDTSELYSSGIIKVAGGSATAPTILTPYLDGSGRLAIRTLTQIGFNYLLESTTNLTPPVVWITNAITAGTGNPLTNSMTISPATSSQFFRYQAQ